MRKVVDKRIIPVRERLRPQLSRVEFPARRYPCENVGQLWRKVPGNVAHQNGLVKRKIQLAVADLRKHEFVAFGGAFLFPPHSREKATDNRLAGDVYLNHRPLVGLYGDYFRGQINKVILLVQPRQNVVILVVNGRFDDNRFRVVVKLAIRLPKSPAPIGNQRDARVV